MNKKDDIWTMFVLSELADDDNLKITLNLDDDVKYPIEIIKIRDGFQFGPSDYTLCLGKVWSDITHYVKGERADKHQVLHKIQTKNTELKRMKIDPRIFNTYRVLNTDKI